MRQLSFTTTGCWSLSGGFGCASLGLAGICGNDQNHVATDSRMFDAIELTGTYEQILCEAESAAAAQNIQAAIVVFGNVGGENQFLAQVQKFLSCPIVGGGAAIDGATGCKGLITGGGEAAVLLITDDRYTYEAKTLCIHDQILERCTLTLEDPRSIRLINGEDAVAFYERKRQELGLTESDFEHLTLSDLRNVNAHLSLVDGKLRSGRDLNETMLLRSVNHSQVYDTIRGFYDDPDAVVFGCAGLSGILDKPLDTKSLGLFLFGEVCMAEGYAEFGNLMLSKLLIRPR